MTDGLRVVLASARLELRRLTRARVLLSLTVLEAVTFLILVTLFGLTGSRAPTALIQEDHGPMATSLIAHLETAHHSFALRPMSATEAGRELARGDLVASITIPAGFSQAVSTGQTVVLPVTVDNVDADLTDDIERAIPSAVTAFGRDNGFPGVRVVALEHDLVGHDTGYIAYLAVSALALDALVVAGVLGGMAMTREWEGRTIVQWHLAPVAPIWLLAGKLVAASLVSGAGVAVAAAVVVVGYGIAPLNLLAMVATLALCTVVFTCLGACAGSLIRRSIAIAPLFFGLALPLYVDSGALEPARFDGNRIWVIAHSSPVYSAIGLLERAVHGLNVTPESASADLVVLTLWAVLAVVVASTVVSRRVTPRP